MQHILTLVPDLHWEVVRYLDNEPLVDGLAAAVPSVGVAGVGGDVAVLDNAVVCARHA